MQHSRHIDHRTKFSQVACVRKEMVEKQTPGDRLLANEVNRIWETFDVDGNGVLDQQEVYEFIREMVRG